MAKTAPAPERPGCCVPGCKRLAMMRDRVGSRIRWRTRCLWHHRHGDKAKAPPERMRLTTGIRCSVKGCRRAPEAFRRPGGRVYVRDVCRVHRPPPTAAAGGKRPSSPRQLLAPVADAPVALTSLHRPWQDTPLKKNATRMKSHPTVRAKGGVWVRDDQFGWFVSDSNVRTILGRNDSSLSLARTLSLPTRVILMIQSQSSRGRL